MPTLKISDVQIEAAKSPRGGFTRNTLAAWGVPWPPPKGWRKALIEGRPIPAHRRRRSGPKVTVPLLFKMPAKLPDVESVVFAVATFLLERGHHEAAADLAENAQTAIAYLENEGS